MRVLVTGADGFLGKNLIIRLNEIGIEHTAYGRRSSTDLRKAVIGADMVFHLAGINRPSDPSEFSGNSLITAQLCDALDSAGVRPPIVYSSSTQASLPNVYGASKLAAETELRSFAARTGTPVCLYRLPNVFGKWSRPNYNSAVATFCHNIARGLPIQINDPSAQVTLVYVDDVVESFVGLTKRAHAGVQELTVTPTYQVTVGELAEKIRSLHGSRDTHVVENVGNGLMRALNATYLSFLPTEQFSYGLKAHTDPRGRFVEMMRTRDAGQFSFLTAHPGVTRGSHYHHTKTERFLVVKGNARFRFRQLWTDERYELTTSADEPRVVETIPGWTHDITNVGDDEMIVILWASENFDRGRPDTVAQKVF